MHSYLSLFSFDIYSKCLFFIIAEDNYFFKLKLLLLLLPFVSCFCAVKFQHATGSTIIYIKISLQKYIAMHRKIYNFAGTSSTEKFSFLSIIRVVVQQWGHLDLQGQISWKIFFAMNLIQISFNEVLLSFNQYLSFSFMSFCMSKKSLTIFYIKLQYKMGQHFLDIK